MATLEAADQEAGGEAEEEAEDVAEVEVLAGLVQLDGLTVIASPTKTSKFYDIIRYHHSVPYDDADYFF